MANHCVFSPITTFFSVSEISLVPHDTHAVGVKAQCQWLGREEVIQENVFSAILDDILCAQIFIPEFSCIACANNDIAETPAICTRQICKVFVENLGTWPVVFRHIHVGMSYSYIFVLRTFPMINEHGIIELIFQIFWEH